ncbi:hypothetical protein ABIE18_004304 [Arthrobacter sp. 2762]
MSPWFERQKVTPPAVEPTVHYVSASAAINASRQRVWDFIKPAENSVLVSPDVVRGFRAPGEEGAGEIQVFISMRDGLEHVSAIEVVEEIPLELAITRTLGDKDPHARGRTFLQGAADGATVLEHGLYFSLPGEAAGHFHQYEQHYRLHCRQYVERVKAFVEQPQAAVADAPPDAER